MEQQELIIRQAVKEDHEAIRQVLIKSYSQYEPQFTEEGGKIILLRLQQL